MAIPAKMNHYRVDFEYDSGNRTVKTSKTDYGSTSDIVLKRVRNDMRQKFKNARNFEIHKIE